MISWNLKVKILFCIIICVYSTHVFARPHFVSTRDNAISFELLGRASLYSLNYDQLVSDEVALGAGCALYTISYNNESTSLLLVPLYVNYYFTPESTRWFVTGGLDLAYSNISIGGNSTIRGSGAFPVLGAGYEYRSDEGFLLRAAPYLIIGSNINLWFGLSGGYTF